MGMAISTQIRPRAQIERARAIKLLANAPRVVGIGFADDGWLCAALWSSGRVPVWCNDADPAPVNALLERVGLPPLGTKTPEALVNAQYELDRLCRPAIGPVPKPKSDAPLVTILICTFNRAHMIEEALASARIQTWPREILVVNDGSTDGTKELLDRLDGQDGIRVIHKENGGKPTALNAGLAASRGEAVLVLDDDDKLMPGALHVLGTALFNNPLVGCVIGDTLVFDGETGEPKNYRPSTRVGPGTAEHMILQQVPGLPGASLIRMSTQRAAGTYDPKLIRGQDMDMYLRLSRAGDIQGIAFPTFWYRAHDGLRGLASGQWKKSNRALHDDRFMACVSPIFERRYREMGEIADRTLSHSWALGLHLRRLPEQARKELGRWKGPFTEREAWIRDLVGLPSRLVNHRHSLLVIDDGDPGALEDTLYRHAKDHSLWVNLEVPRDPLGSVRLFWPGTYGARENPKAWFNGPGDIHIRLSSDPHWAPPPIESKAWLPDAPSIEAIQLLGAALGWDEPVVRRNGLVHAPTERVQQVRMARKHLNAGEANVALARILPVIRALPTWPGGWKLAAEGFMLRGDKRLAQQWISRIENIRSAS